MSELETRSLRDQLVRGLNLTFSKLVEEKKSTNSELAFSHEGEVIKVKAVDI
jgi:hypothetical protein